MLQFYLCFPCHAAGTGSILRRRSNHSALSEKGCSLRVEMRTAACQGFSLITGHIAPDAASGACGGRTIRPSEWANIFIMDESCFP